jgi:hypothetical protein
VNEASYGVRAESTGRWNYHNTGQLVEESQTLVATEKRSKNSEKVYDI